MFVFFLGLTVTLSAAKNVVMEDEKKIMFTVQVIGHFERDLSLQFSTEDNSASGKGQLTLDQGDLLHLA